MTPAEAAVALDDEPLDLAGYEAPVAVPQTPLLALYRLRAAALQLIDLATEREADAARKRLRLDKQIQAQTAFDWTTAEPMKFVQGRVRQSKSDPKRIAWEDSDAYFVW